MPSFKKLLTIRVTYCYGRISVSVRALQNSRPDFFVRIGELGVAMAESDELRAAYARRNVVTTANLSRVGLVQKARFYSLLTRE